MPNYNMSARALNCNVKHQAYKQHELVHKRHTQTNHKLQTTCATLFKKYTLPSLLFHRGF